MRLITPRFHVVYRYFKDRPFTLLDVGAGNHSASLAKKYFPECKYYGIDRSKHYNNDEDDFRAMEEFYEMDLNELDFARIPDGHFDLIMMVHVIEHLPKGETVINALLPKLKPGGYIYIEYPSINSIRLPSKEGTLNFFDDDTHLRLYSPYDLYNLLIANGMIILKSGTRRFLSEIVLFPAKAIYSKIKSGSVRASLFWDLLGFADFVFARRR